MAATFPTGMGYEKFFVFLREPAALRCGSGGKNPFPTVSRVGSHRQAMDDLRGRGKMKLLTAVIPPNRLARVMAALDGAGMTATTVATAQASELQGERVQHRGVEHRDQRCVRLEVLVSDLDAEVAVGLLTEAGGPDPGDLILWASDVARPAMPRPLAGAGATVSHT